MARGSLPLQRIEVADSSLELMKSPIYGTSLCSKCKDKTLNHEVHEIY